MNLTWQKKINNFFAFKIKPDIFFICALSFIPIFRYYLLTFITSVNIPYRDDYDAILNFANIFVSNTHNKLTLLFSFHNEHRILFCRASTVLLYSLSGKINFKILSMIGTFSLLAFVAVLLSSTVFSTKKIKLLYFIPVVFILFQPQYWECSLVSMGSLSSLPVLFFAFITLYYLSADGIINFLFSLVAAIFTTFINGNGMLIFLSGLIILYFYKRYQEGMIWILAGIVTIYAYFIGWPASHPNPMGIFNQSMEALKYFFYFIGSALPSLPARFRHTHLLSLSSGILFFVYFIFLSFKIKNGKVNITTFAFLAYLFMTALVVTLCRFGLGVAQVFCSRYTIYSDLFIIFVYISFIELSPGKMIRLIFPFLLILSILFNCKSYKDNYPMMFHYKKALLHGLADWRKNNNSGLEYPWDQAWANIILKKAIKNGLYEPPKT